MYRAYVIVLSPQPYCEGILDILNTVAMKLDTLISINDS